MKRILFKSLAILGIASLLFQNLSFLPGFSAERFKNTPQALANNMCSVDVDVVLIMDRSGSMQDGYAPSKCEWPEMKMHGSAYTWFLNTKYNVSEDWCNNTKDSFDTSEPVFQYLPQKYTPARNAKITDAKNAAKSFLDNFEANDQSALVSFADLATLDQPFSNDHNQTKSSIDALLPSGATNIGEAIQKGIDELNSERARPRANKVMILLTDGKANKPNGDGYNENPLDVQYAKDKAQEAANQGYKIFTVGLGGNSEINEAMLQEIAQISSAKYYHSPNGDGLAEIYQNIAYEVCQYGSISGCKYQDKNKNGILDEGEEKLSDWEIVLSPSSGTPLSQKTGEDGCYSFAGLSDGIYSVFEGPNLGQGEFIQTYPQELVYENIAIDVHDQNLKDISGIDFANYFPSCGNGILDDGEECDDANNEDGDSCNSTCQLEQISCQPEELSRECISDGQANVTYTYANPACGSNYSQTERDPDCDCVETEIPGECVSETHRLFSFSYNFSYCQAREPEPREDSSCAIEPPAIQPGDIVINEIMNNPEKVSDSYGEWFELYNPTNSAINLSGCVIRDLAINEHSITSLIVPAKGYVVLAKNGDANANGGITPDYVYSNFILSNAPDQIILECDGIEIDRVEYDYGVTFPDPVGASMILSDYSLDNNIGSNWCVSVSSYGLGDLGTPGAINDSCNSQTCQAEEISRVCVSDGYAEVTYHYPNPDCGQDYAEQVSDSSCVCVIQSEAASECVSETHRLFSLTYNHCYCEPKTEQRPDSSCAQTPPSPEPINPGDLVINEIMANPAKVLDSDGEWFELYNASAKNLDLEGCIIRDSGADSHIISGSLLIPNGGYLVLANNVSSTTNGGIIPNYVYDNFSLYNDVDQIILECNDIEIDRVEYDTTSDFPYGSGASMCLANPSIDNNIGWNWCLAKSVFGDGDLGTPGQANDECEDRRCESFITGKKLDFITEKPIEDWWIELRNPLTWEIIEAATTSQTGEYRFDHLCAGSYLVNERQEENWRQTLPSDENYFRQDLGYYYSISLLIGQSARDKNFINGDLSLCQILITSSECAGAGLRRNYYSYNYSYCGEDYSEDEEDNSCVGSVGGGGGAVSLTYQDKELIIFNETALLEGDVASLSWETNLTSNTKIVYSTADEARALDKNNPNLYGYSHSFINHSQTEVKLHSAKIPWLQECATYYFVPVSEGQGGKIAFGEELILNSSCPEEEKKEEEPIAPEIEIPSAPPSIGGPVTEEEEKEDIIFEEEEEKETTEEEVEEELEEEQSMSENFLASLAGLLRGFGNLCELRLPWWTILLLAAYALGRALESLVKKNKQKEFIWLALGLGFIVLVLALYVSKIYFISFWLFIVLLAAAVFPHYFFSEKKKEWRGVFLCGLIIVLILLFFCLLARFL